MKAVIAGSGQLYDYIHVLDGDAVINVPKGIVPPDLLGFGQAVDIVITVARRDPEPLPKLEGEEELDRWVEGLR